MQDRQIQDDDQLIAQPPQPSVSSQGQFIQKRGSDPMSKNEDRRSSYLDQNGEVHVAEQMKELELKQREEDIIKNRFKLQMFLNSRTADVLIVTLVLIYTLLVFINFAFTGQEVDNDAKVALALFIVSIIEFTILIVFLIEIVLKSYSIGVKAYFKDTWLIFDAIVIVITIVLIILDWTLNNLSFKVVSKVLRGIFRFLRLFLVFRKFNQVKRISKQNSRYIVKAPVEKILEILGSLCNEFDDPEIINEIKWSIEKISSNKLYDPLIESVKGKSQVEANNWIESIGQKKHQKNQTKDEGETTQFQNNWKSSFKVKMQLEILEYLSKNVDQIDFDCFTFHAQNGYLILPYLVRYIFETFQVYNDLSIDQNQLNKYIDKIAKGYRDISYHNVMHAFDVTQTIYFFLTQCQFKQIASLNSLDICSLIVAGAIHDYDHPCKQYLLDQYKGGTCYNLQWQHTLNHFNQQDKSPLENHHVSSAFILLLEEQYNFTSQLKKESFKYFRERIISMVLATDMSVHFADQGKLKGRLASNEFDPKDKDKSLCMDSLLHSADISNPIKPFKIYEQWTARVLEEFWLQGDKERDRGIQISYLCDRFTTNTAKSQIGFIEFVVQPTYVTIQFFLPELKNYMNNFTTNKELWKEKISYFDADLQQLRETQTLKELEQRKRI